MTPIWMTNLPVPPSINFSYIPMACKKISKKTGKEYWGGRLRPSDELILYKRQIKVYKYRHAKTLKSMSDYLTRFVEAGLVLRVDVFVAFHHERVFSVPNKKILALDANNRVKAALDGVVTLLGIDDSVYFRGDCEKVTTVTKDSECVLVRIQPVQPRTLSQIQAQMMQELAATAPKS